MKIAIIINASRLTEALKTQLQSNTLSKEHGIDYDVYTAEAKEMEQTIKSLLANEYQGYLIGGGDGTVRQVIQSLIDNGATDTPIAILPLGTFNLLAKSLNYPNEISKIFSIIKNNKTKMIDLIDVNGALVINHAWIGFYFYILKQRKKHKNFGKSRLLKSIFNTLTLFKLLPVYNLTVEVEGEKLHYATCLVYVGNNEFYTSLLNLGDRTILSSGLMSVTILNVINRWQLFLCMLHLIIGRVKNSKYITYFYTPTLEITAKSNLINIVIDGELFKLESPLTFRNHQKCLKVIIP